jgi:hypothetical protein
MISMALHLEELIKETFPDHFTEPSHPTQLSLATISHSKYLTPEPPKSLILPHLFDIWLSHYNLNMRKRNPPTHCNLCYTYSNACHVVDAQFNVSFLLLKFQILSLPKKKKSIARGVHFQPCHGIWNTSHTSTLSMASSPTLFLLHPSSKQIVALSRTRWAEQNGAETCTFPGPVALWLQVCGQD